MSITVSWMGIQAIIRSLYHQRTKRKQHSRARMVRFLLGECSLNYVTHGHVSALYDGYILRHGRENN